MRASWDQFCWQFLLLVYPENINIIKYLSSHTKSGHNNNQALKLKLPVDEKYTEKLQYNNYYIAC